MEEEKIAKIVFNAGKATIISIPISMLLFTISLFAGGTTLMPLVSIIIILAILLLSLISILGGFYGILALKNYELKKKCLYGLLMAIVVWLALLLLQLSTSIN